MRFIIELEGTIFDVKNVHYAAYQQAVTSVGWSCLDQSTFWRLWRKQGLEAALLTGARATNIKQFWKTFQTLVMSPAYFCELMLLEDAYKTICSLQRFGMCVGLTTGDRRMLDEYQRRLDRADTNPGFVSYHVLPDEMRLRTAKLADMTTGDDRSIVIASTDIVARAGSSANVFVIGLPLGSCHASRLHRNGADLVYKSLDDIIKALEDGAADMIKAGLKPASLG